MVEDEAVIAQRKNSPFLSLLHGSKHAGGV